MNNVILLDATPEGTVHFEFEIEERYANLNGVMQLVFLFFFFFLQDGVWVRISLVGERKNSGRGREKRREGERRTGDIADFLKRWCCRSDF